MTAAALAGWAVDALVASALLLLAVMLVRVPVRRTFGPGVAYLLWALPLLRLVLPPMPVAWRDAAAMPISRAGETVTVLVFDSNGTASAVANGSTAVLFAGGFAIWCTGAVLFMLFHFARHARFCRRVLDGATGSAVVVEGVRVLTSEAAPGPLAFGVRRRYVAFPRDFAERYDADERALALAHELGHHQRGDLLANWLALGVLAVHWFNPLAWRAFRAFRADQELANDARVLAGREAALRHAYGRAIVKAAHGAVVSPACHLHSIADLKGRLRMLARSPASRRRLLSGAATVTALVVAGLGLTASGSGAAAITASVKQTMDVPQAPPPPAAPLAQPAVPAAPAAPAVPARRGKHVVVVRNGEAKTFDGAAADQYLAEHDIAVPPAPPVPPALLGRDLDGRLANLQVVIPDIRNMRCPGSDRTRPVVEHQYKGGRQRIIFCTNRMEAMTRDAAQIAANAGMIEQHARAQARASLGLARAAIERDRNLTDDQRREALEGVAHAEAELSAAD